MPDPAAPLLQNIKDANPVAAIRDKVGGAISDISSRFTEPDNANAPAVLAPKPMPQANAEFQQHIDEQAAIERGKAYFAAHPEQYQASAPTAQETPAQERADVTGGEAEGPGAETENPMGAVSKAAGMVGQPGANVIQPAMTAMGLPRAGGTIASAIDYYMWPPQMVGDLARKAGMSEAHATLIQHAVAGGYIAMTGYGALRAGKEAAEGVAGAIKANPESELGGGAATGGQPQEGPVAAGPGQAEPEPRKVEPEAMYTTGTEAPGKQVGEVGPIATQGQRGAYTEAGRRQSVISALGPEAGPEYDRLTSILQKDPQNAQAHEQFMAMMDEVTEDKIGAAAAKPADKEGNVTGPLNPAATQAAPQEAPKGATEVPHTIPEAVAEATRTPFSREKIMSLKDTLAAPEGAEEGHAMLKTPLDAVDTVRMHRYATDQAAKVIDAYRTGDMETATKEMGHLAEDVYGVYKGAAHAAGYGLRVFGKPVSEDVPMLKDVWGAIENSNGGYDQMIKAMASLPDAGTARKFAEMTASMAATKDPSVIGNIAHGIANYYTHALLSVNTIAKKAATDSFMMAFGPVQTAVGEGLSGVAKAFGSENTIAPGRAAAGIQGYTNSAREAFQIGWKAMKSNVSQLDERIWGPAGYHDPSEGTLSGTGIPVLGHALSWYGKIVDLPSRGILGVDNFAKVMQQRRMLHEFAWQKAYDGAANLGIEGEDFAKAVQAGYGKLIERPDADIMARSIQEARRQTMTAPLSDYGLGGLQKMASAVRGNPLGQMLIPFFNTPVNLAMQGTEFAGPLGLASKVMRDQLLSDTPERFTALAKLGMGSVFWAAVWDNLHGSSPDNAQVKKLTEGEEQHQPYSISIGNHEVGNIPAPLDNSLGVLADAKEMLGRLPPDSRDAGGIATAVSLLLMKQLDSSSSMQNLSGFVNLLAGGAKQFSASELANQRAAEETPESVDEQEQPQGQGIREVANAEGKRALMKFAGSFIPTTLADVAHGIDPIHRDVRNYMDEVKSRIPGLSASVKPDVDLFGKDVATPLGWNRATGNTVSLFRTTDIKSDPVIAKLAALNPAIPAIGADGTLPVGMHGAMAKVPATDAQIYQAQKLRGLIRDPSTGQTLKEALTSIVNDPEFKKAPSGRQLRVMTRVIAGFTHGAIAETVAQNPDLQQGYAAARQPRGGQQVSMGAQ